MQKRNNLSEPSISILTKESSLSFVLFYFFNSQIPYDKQGILRILGQVILESNYISDFHSLVARIHTQADKDQQRTGFKTTHRHTHTHTDIHTTSQHTEEPSAPQTTVQLATRHLQALLRGETTFPRSWLQTHSPGFNLSCVKEVIWQLDAFIVFPGQCSSAN